MKIANSDSWVENHPVKGDPCVYIDLYRVEHEKIAERWGFREQTPPQEERKKNNGMI